MYTEILAKWWVFLCKMFFQMFILLQPVVNDLTNLYLNSPLFQSISEGVDSQSRRRRWTRMAGWTSRSLFAARQGKQHNRRDGKAFSVGGFLRCGALMLFVGIQNSNGLKDTKLHEPCCELFHITIACIVSFCEVLKIFTTPHMAFFIFILDKKPSWDEISNLAWGLIRKIRDHEDGHGNGHTLPPMEVKNGMSPITSRFLSFGGSFALSWLWEKGYLEHFLVWYAHPWCPCFAGRVPFRTIQRNTSRAWLFSQGPPVRWIFVIPWMLDTSNVNGMLRR